MLICFASVKSWAQKEVEQSITIYVASVSSDNVEISSENTSFLVRKTTSIANQSGLVNFGVSNFLMHPHLEVLDTETALQGTTLKTVVKLELKLNISRINNIINKNTPPDGNISGNSLYNNYYELGVFHSETYTILGKGANRELAIKDAITKIDPKEIKYAQFLQEAKDKISTYYTNHCDDVIALAASLYSRRELTQALLLLNSIPTGAYCYQKGLTEMTRVFAGWLEDSCQAQKTQVSMLLTLAGNPNNQEHVQDYYSQALKTVKRINPAAKCYDEIMVQLETLSEQFAEENKLQWELRKDVINSNTNIELAALKLATELQSKQSAPQMIYVETGK
jgi:hypothetical protein